MILASEAPAARLVASPPRVLGVAALAFAIFNCVSLVPATCAGLAYALQEKLKRVRGAATKVGYYPTPQ